MKRDDLIGKYVLLVSTYSLVPYCNVRFCQRADTDTDNDTEVGYSA